MALLVTVLKCDLCGAKVALSGPDDWDAFVRDWHDGLKYHFCGSCRSSATGRARVNEDEELRELIRKSLSDREETRDAGYIN